MLVHESDLLHLGFNHKEKFSIFHDMYLEINSDLMLEISNPGTNKAKYFLSEYDTFIEVFQNTEVTIDKLKTLIEILK